MALLLELLQSSYARCYEDVGTVLGRPWNLESIGVNYCQAGGTLSFCRTRRTEADFADFAPGQLGVLKRVLDYKSQQSIELFRRNKLQEQLAAISFHLSNGQRWKQNSSLIREFRFLKSN